MSDAPVHLDDLPITLPPVVMVLIRNNHGLWLAVEVDSGFAPPHGALRPLRGGRHYGNPDFEAAACLVEATTELLEKQTPGLSARSSYLVGVFAYLGRLTYAVVVDRWEGFPRVVQGRGVRALSWVSLPASDHLYGAILNLVEVGRYVCSSTVFAGEVSV